MPDLRLSFESRLLRRMLRSLGDPPVEIELGWWPGRHFVAGTNQPLRRVRIKDRQTLLGLLRNPQIRFGDAYSSGQIEIEGDLIDFMAMMLRVLAAPDTPESLWRRFAHWRNRSRRHNSLTGSLDNIHRHYDLGNDFYALWLGETMAYTCAYFPSGQAGLDQAQVAKMDHVCRKVRLGASDTVVEAGCGWGSLALHMARIYGAKVRAFNISAEQIDYARSWARRLGLANRVEFVQDDYRNIDGRYDVFMSVGMLEHVGREHYRELGGVIRASGAARGLVHSIGRNRPEPLHSWIERRIFPGAYPPSLGEMMQIFEPWNISVLDVENLRLHYALTLRCWLKNFEAALDKVRSLSFDERFLRMWRLYLASSAAAFETGDLQLFQIVFAAATNNHVPLSREFMYREP